MKRGFTMTASAHKPSAFMAPASNFPASAQGERKRGRFADCEEPALSDLFDDPILRRLMASDGIAADQLMQVIATARMKLG
jgi:hypothetical protein